MKINGQTPEAAGKFPKFILYDGRQLTIDPPKGVTVTRLDCDGVIR
ncbi:MAG: hypothetical protein U5N55_12760 [Cypionkella sp.]|nr:hypothetical protein [Cypionkella sp.]